MNDYWSGDNIDGGFAARMRAASKQRALGQIKNVFGNLTAEKEFLGDYPEVGAEILERMRSGVTAGQMDEARTLASQNAFNIPGQREAIGQNPYVAEMLRNVNPAADRIREEEAYHRAQGGGGAMPASAPAMRDDTNGTTIGAVPQNGETPTMRTEPHSAMQETPMMFGGTAAMKDPRFDMAVQGKMASHLEGISQSNENIAQHGDAREKRERIKMQRQYVQQAMKLMQEKPEELEKFLQGADTELKTAAVEYALATNKTKLINSGILANYDRAAVRQYAEENPWVTLFDVFLKHQDALELRSHQLGIKRLEAATKKSESKINPDAIWNAGVLAFQTGDENNIAAFRAQSQTHSGVMDKIIEAESGNEARINENLVEAGEQGIVTGMPQATAMQRQQLFLEMIREIKSVPPEKAGYVQEKYMEMGLTEADIQSYLSQLRQMSGGGEVSGQLPNGGAVELNVTPEQRVAIMQARMGDDGNLKRESFIPEGEDPSNAREGVQVAPGIWGTGFADDKLFGMRGTPGGNVGGGITGVIQYLSNNDRGEEAKQVQTEYDNVRSSTEANSAGRFYHGARVAQIAVRQIEASSEDASSKKLTLPAIRSLGALLISLRPTGGIGGGVHESAHADLESPTANIVSQKFQQLGQWLSGDLTDANKEQLIEMFNTIGTQFSMEANQIRERQFSRWNKFTNQTFPTQNKHSKWGRKNLKDAFPIPKYDANKLSVHEIGQIMDVFASKIPDPQERKKAFFDYLRSFKGIEPSLNGGLLLIKLQGKQVEIDAGDFFDTPQDNAEAVSRAMSMRREMFARG